MALTANNSTRMWPGANNIGMNLIITDNNRPDLGEGEQVVINAQIKRQFVTGDDITDRIRDSIGEEAQERINSYKAERAIYDKPIYQTKIDQIKGALTL